MTNRFDPDRPPFRGGCHCGAIRFRVSEAIADTLVCNCSICTRTAYIHWEVAPENFTLDTPDAPIRTYQFGTRTSKNTFCEVCGISPFRVSRSAPSKIDVNVRCLDDVDLESLEPAHFDGRNWEDAIRKR